MRNAEDRSCGENQNTFYFQKYFSKNRVFMRKFEKILCSREGHR
jgi:hypothetical protein